MYSIYFNQKAILKTKKTANDCGESTYNEIEIKCRFQYKTILAKSPNGSNIESVAQIFTNNKCNIKDFILYDEQKFVIIGVDQMVDVNGKNSYYIYYLNRG
jgi:transcriptional antiterminator Rof (Rho-off)